MRNVLIIGLLSIGLIGCESGSPNHPIVTTPTVPMVYDDISGDFDKVQIHEYANKSKVDVLTLKNGEPQEAKTILRTAKENHGVSVILSPGNWKYESDGRYRFTVLSVPPDYWRDSVVLNGDAGAESWRTWTKQ